LVPGLRPPALDVLTDQNRVGLVRDPVEVGFAHIHLNANCLLGN
jgi:hypothetical protein